MAAIETEGGAHIDGDLQTGGGDAAGRDDIGATGNRNQINISLENNDRLIELKEQLTKIEEDYGGNEASIHARLSRLEQHIDWKFELITRDLSTLRDDLLQQKMKQANYPTWFQVLEIVLAATLLVMLLIFVAKLNAVDKSSSRQATPGIVLEKK